MLHHPLRTLVPVIARKTGLSGKLQFRTFWGGEFRGLIPEDVSTLVWRQGYFDLTVCKSMLHLLKPGDRFLDIGAHFGFFSLLGSHLVGASGEVHSIEAMPQTFEMLSYNAKHNAKLANITLHNVAAHHEKATLQFGDFGILNSSLNSHHAPRNERLARPEEYPKIAVDAVAMDSLFSGQTGKNLKLVKIDAESSELQVIEGMKNLIATSAPALVVEISGMNEEVTIQGNKIMARLESLGYAAFRWDGPQLVRADGLPDTYDNYLFMRSA